MPEASSVSALTSGIGWLDGQMEFCQSYGGIESSKSFGQITLILLIFHQAWSFWPGFGQNFHV